MGWKGWIGTDTNRLWLKSEGFSNMSKFSHGDRIASADTRFGEDENTHGRFPEEGSTVRFPREVGWGNAMRYMLTGDHWNAEEAYRIGEVQQIAPTPKKALEAGVLIANKIAACGPLGIETTLTSAHLSIDHTEEKALSKLDVQFGALFHT
jgi:enoyl-CoA hydratase